MKIVMMSRWNTPCGVSLHAELIGRAWVEMGHDLKVLAPVEWKDYRTQSDEPFVERCYRLPEPERKEGFFFDPKAFIENRCDVFVVQNLEIQPMKELLEIYPIIKSRSKTIFVVHEGRPPKDPLFYKFDWDAIICFDGRYKRFLRNIYSENKIKIIPYPCHPILYGDKIEARHKLNLPTNKKIIFNYGIGIYRHLHLLPTIERVSHRYPLVLLTLTHIPEWFELFSTVKERYKFIELRKGDISIRELYTYLHASDCLLVHKDSAEVVVVPSTCYLCLGSGCPILAYDTNFFEAFNREVVKYRSLETVLEDVFEERENIKFALKAAEKYVEKNSSYDIARRFIKLFTMLSGPKESSLRIAVAGN